MNKAVNELIGWYNKQDPNVTSQTEIEVLLWSGNRYDTSFKRMKLVGNVHELLMVLKLMPEDSFEEWDWCIYG